MFFQYMEQVRLSHKQHKNIFKLDIPDPDDKDLNLILHQMSRKQDGKDSIVLEGQSAENNEQLPSMVKDTSMPELPSHSRSNVLFDKDLKRSKTLKKSPSKQIRSGQIDKMSYSFDSSDMEAYANESPIPVVKQAYMQY